MSHGAVDVGFRRVRTDHSGQIATVPQRSGQVRKLEPSFGLCGSGQVLTIVEISKLYMYRELVRDQSVESLPGVLQPGNHDRRSAVTAGRPVNLGCSVDQENPDTLQRPGSLFWCRRANLAGKLLPDSVQHRTRADRRCSIVVRCTATRTLLLIRSIIVPEEDLLGVTIGSGSMHRRFRRHSFTLIELLVVIAIIAIPVALLLPAVRFRPGLRDS